MAAKKITDEDWLAARKRYEGEPGLGYGALAQVLDCSRALVARRAQRAGWQKGIDVIAASNRPAPAADSIFTENPQHRAVQTPRVHSQADGRLGHVGVAPAAPADVLASRAPADLGAAPEMPEGLTRTEQQDWIERAVVARQTALNRKQAQELKAAKATVYAAIKVSAGKDGFNAARTARQIVSALAEQHARELENEAVRVRLELGAFHGVQGQRPVRISVLIVPGYQIGGANQLDPVGSRVVEVGSMAEAARVVRGGDIEDVEVRSV